MSHTGELRPDLGEDANMSAVDHVRLEKVEVGDVGVLTFFLDRRLDLAEFELDDWRITVALRVDKSENIMGLFPPVVFGEPARRLNMLAPRS